MEAERTKGRKARPMRRRRKLTLAAAALIVAVSLLVSGIHALFPAFPGWDELFLAVGLREGAPFAAGGHAPGFLFVDVGQGDCTVALGEQVSVLIDAGPSDAVHRVRQALSDHGVERLDALILTHPHEDHIGGAAALVKEYTVDAIYLPEGQPEDETDRECFDALLDAAATRQVELVRLSESAELPIGELTLSIYCSPLSLSDENETGLVVRAALPKLSALITGDAGTDTEFALMERGDLLGSDILKVGHHGSKTSTSSAFLRRVAPKIAVISVGRNSYGHPNQTVMERLSDANIMYYRTDINGTLFFADADDLLSSIADSSVA